MLKQFNDVLKLTKPLMLLEDRLPVGSMGVLYGAPKVGKSFITLDWCIRLAKEGVSVLYLAGEGISGYGARARAWVEHFGALESEFLPFWLSDRMINFTDTGNAGMFLQEIRETFKEEQLVGGEYDETTGEQYGAELTEMPGTVDLIVVDTLSRSLPGVDENDQGEMSKAINRIDAFRKATNSTMLFVHHTTKADAKKWRGSSVIEGAADVMMLAYEKDANIVVEVQAAREFDSTDKVWYYKLEPVLDSAVVVKVDDPEAFSVQSPAQEDVLTALRAGARTIPEIIEKTARSRVSIVQLLLKLIEKGIVTRIARGEYGLAEEGLDSSQ